MLIVFVNSLLWVWSGRDGQHPLFNGLAVGGFVATVLMLFWGHLRLHALQAYVIPVGSGILILLRLFHERVERQVRNAVRMVVLLAMLGTAAYEALTADAHSVVFHLTFLLLSLAAMGLGGWLGVRLYLLLGFTGALVDLASIAATVFRGLDRGIQMTVLGLVVLLLGVAFVTGAVVYKTRRAEIQARLAEWKKRLAQWE
jgi:hypothetical protein